MRNTMLYSYGLHLPGDPRALHWIVTVKPTDDFVDPKRTSADASRKLSFHFRAIRTKVVSLILEGSHQAQLARI